MVEKLPFFIKTSTVIKSVAYTQSCGFSVPLFTNLNAVLFFGS